MDYEKFPCVYCGRYNADTVDHLLPRSICRRLGKNYPERNLVTCCKECNALKDNTVILPTVANIHGMLGGVKFKVIYSYADFLHSYYKVIVKRICMARGQYAMTNSTYGYGLRALSEFIDEAELNEVVYLFDSGYYEYLIELYGEDAHMLSYVYDELMPLRVLRIPEMRV